MDTFVINRSKQNTIQFDLKVEGSSVEEAIARFIIQCENYNISIDCSRVSQQTFTVVIPPLNFLTTGVHDCMIEVIINNQFFVPLKEVVTVVDDVKVSVSTPSMEDEEKNLNKNSTNTHPSPIIISPNSANITRFLQMRNAAEEEEKVVENEKEKKIKQILESVALQTNKKPKVKTSLKELTKINRKKSTK